MTVEKPIVGWREWLSLPDLDVDAIKAKVDTGARTSALHAWDVQHFRRRGQDWVRFVVHPEQRSTKREITTEAPLLEQRWIRSSNGVREQRPVILTTVKWADLAWEIELTLTSRDVMGFRMLLGRQAVKKQFLVDPGRSYLGRKRGKKKVKKKASKR